jgi:hypothetical protein
MMTFAALLLGWASVRNCGSASDRASILNIVSDPVNPVPGDNVTLSVQYSFAGEPITGGTAHYKAVVNYFPVYDETYDLCTQTNCPKDPGTYTEVSTSQVPASISGKIVTTINWADQNSNPVWCVETTWKV